METTNDLEPISRVNVTVLQWVTRGFAGAARAMAQIDIGSDMSENGVVREESDAEFVGPGVLCRKKVRDEQVGRHWWSSVLARRAKTIWRDL